MDDIYENIEENNPEKKHKILIEPDYVIANVPTKEKSYSKSF